MLIYEKFRSQIAFESGQHFLSKLRAEYQVKSNLLEHKCKDLETSTKEQRKEHE